MITIYKLKKLVQFFYKIKKKKKKVSQIYFINCVKNVTMI